MAEVSVIGAGYVGMTTATGMASLGHNVVVADVIPERVAALSRGELPIIEHGMERSPRRRYETIELLEADLRAFLDHRPVSVRPLTTLGRSWRRADGLPAGLVGLG